VTPPVATETVRVPVDGTVTDTATGLLVAASEPTCSEKVPFDPRKLPVGVNVAVTDTRPEVAGAVVEVDAVPVADTVTGVPTLVPPTANCTVPVGIAVEPTDVTVAFRVSGPPVGDGFGVADTEVVVAVWPGGLEAVEYAPAAVTVTNVDCTYTGVPVPAPAGKQATAHSTVPPAAVRLVDDSRLVMLPSNVALVIGAVGLFTTPDTRVAGVPSVLNSSTAAEALLPDGHAVDVDHVGCVVPGPLAGFSVRLPG